MRTVKFKDVLWSVARKGGQEPDQGDFLTNQAIPVGEYISQWVHRLWPSQDFPEWTETEAFIPVNHVVPYGDNILKVFAVYLFNPASTSAPVETDFKLTPAGIHVGFNHGTQVWIKFLPLAPVFTAEVWMANQIYARNEVVYSFGSGECYKSKSNSNRGHDPSDLLESSINAATTQAFSPATPATPAQPRIVHIDYSAITPLAIGDHVAVSVLEGALLIADVTFTSIQPATAPYEAYANITSQLITALPTYTITQDGAHDKVILQRAADFGVTAQWSIFGGPDITTPVVQDQPYIPAIAAVPAARQLTEIVFSQSQSTPLATYDLTIIDGAGVEHVVEYVALANDDGVQIILGLIQAITDSLDPFFNGVFSSIDPDSVKLTLSFGEAVSVSLTFLQASSPWWELVLFPDALADAVERGAVADLRKEWGQTQEGMAEEQAVPGEAAVATAKFTASPDPMTEQQRTGSRYKV